MDCKSDNNCFVKAYVLNLHDVVILTINGYRYIVLNYLEIKDSLSI